MCTPLPAYPEPETCHVCFPRYVAPVPHAASCIEVRFVILIFGMPGRVPRSRIPEPRPLVRVPVTRFTARERNGNRNQSAWPIGTDAGAAPMHH